MEFVIRIPEAVIIEVWLREAMSNDSKTCIGSDRSCSPIVQQSTISCYTVTMTFGTGVSLRQFSPYLRNDAARHQMILDRVERDSVIEGLPKFTKESRAECLNEIKKASRL